MVGGICLFENRKNAVRDGFPYVLVDFLTCMLMLCECVHTFCLGEIPNLNSGVAAGCHKLRTTAMITEITNVLGKQFYLIKIKVGTNVKNVKFYN